MLEQFFVEGLKAAVLKGESLKSAMNSFINAGYNPAEVEEAAKILQKQNISLPSKPLSKVIPIQKLSEQNIFNNPISRINSIKTQNPSSQNYSSQGQVNPFVNKPNQLSNYGQKPKTPKRLLIILIIICLIILVGILIWLLLF